MKCQLCLKNYNLINSHILPEYLYKPLYTPVPGHQKVRRIYIIYSDPKKKLEFEQKGLREKLMCTGCDNNLIGNNEDYAKKEIERIKHNIRGSIRFRRIIIKGINYHSFRLFQLSILWRASITNLEQFKAVNLDSNTNEELRVMLLNQDPGHPKKYGCQILYTPCKNKLVRNLRNQIIIPPEKALNIGGFTVYRFLFAGLWWLFYISNSIDPIYEELFINREGNLPVFFDNKYSENWLYLFLKEQGIANLERQKNGN